MNGADEHAGGQVTIDMGGGLQSLTREKQMSFSLTEMEFRILCEGTLKSKLGNWAQTLGGICLATGLAFYSMAPAAPPEQWTGSYMTWIGFGVVAMATFLGVVACLLLQLKFKTGSVSDDLKAQIQAYFDHDGKISS